MQDRLASDESVRECVFPAAVKAADVLHARSKGY